MPQNYTRQFLIYGNSLAASMTVLALSKVLPPSIKLVWVKPNGPCLDDMLYGGLTSPEAYQFNLEYGVTEPELLLETNTTFSFGTQYNRWGENERNWMQCFHLPFSTASGVDFHHFITKHNAVLSDYLISAQAALKGTFAHPPTDKPQSALSRAEYGYHFEPSQWAKLFSSKVDEERVEVVSGEMDSIKWAQDQIEYIQLENGPKYKANLYIDCSGVKNQLAASLDVDNSFEQQRIVQIDINEQCCDKTGPAHRIVEGTKFGWRSVTPLRETNTIMSLYESSFGYEQNDCQTFVLGFRSNPWQGNCIAMGHSAYALEPVSTAPYMLLTRDIKRLLELIPVADDTKIEQREYNQRFRDDVKHAELFHRALYFEQRDVGYGVCDKLERKLSQYLHRGVLANYDFEPFNQQDWTILHAGMGRQPNRFDRMAEHVDFEQMQAKLNNMQAGIAYLASSMPPHHIYLQQLSEYLKKNERRG